MSLISTGPNAFVTASLKVSTEISSSGWLLAAAATEAAITRSRFGIMLLLLSMRNAIDAGTSSAENISSFCACPSSITVNASAVRPVT